MHDPDEPFLCIYRLAVSEDTQIPLIPLLLPCLLTTMRSLNRSMPQCSSTASLTRVHAVSHFTSLQHISNSRLIALLPNYFISYFRHCILGPLISFPMPPLPPLQPLPRLAPVYNLDVADNLNMDIQLFAQPTKPTQRAPARSFSSTISGSTAISALTSDSDTSDIFSITPRNKANSVSTNASERPKIEISLSPPDQDVEGIQLERLRPGPSTPITGTHLSYILDSSSTDMTTAPSVPKALFPIQNLAALDERSSAMHLLKSYRTILASQEALWDELKDRLRNRREELKPFGWDDEEAFESEFQHRKKFEMLVSRYQK